MMGSAANSGFGKVFVTGKKGVQHPMIHHPMGSTEPQERLSSSFQMELTAFLCCFLAAAGQFHSRIKSIVTESCWTPSL